MASFLREADSEQKFMHHFFFCEFEAHVFSWVSYANRLQSSSGRSTNLLRCDVHNLSFFLYLIDVIIHTILPLSFTVLVTHRMFPRNAFSSYTLKYLWQLSALSVIETKITLSYSFSSLTSFQKTYTLYMLYRKRNMPTTSYNINLQSPIIA